MSFKGNFPDSIHSKMAKFLIADFNRVIPEFKGDSTNLSVFIKRCDTFNNSLDPEGKTLFLSNLIYKLGGKAFLIYESKPHADWAALKADLIERLKVTRSASALQRELGNLIIHSISFV